MGMSARVLGQELGLSAPEMNQALSQAGLLEGKPQAWGLTEEGRKYASAERKWNGVSGHQRYIIDYDQVTWDPEVLEVLDLDDDKVRAARDAASEARRRAREATAATAVDVSTIADASQDDGSDSDGFDPKWILVGVAVFGSGLAIYKVAPRLKRRWDEKRAQREQSGS
jgi:hypothetical protein